MRSTRVRQLQQNTWQGRLALLLAFSIATAPGAAFAGPKDGKVAKGKATITYSNGHTQIDTYKKKTIIDWRSFDVGATETVRIEQPNKKSRTMNRVSSASQTQIDGSVTSNGQVWIINPAGVYFGGQAVVEVQRLVAGAGHVEDKHFLKNKQRFSGLAGVVQNDGTINATRGVTLAGTRVANYGQLVSRKGDIVMAAGDEVRVVRHDTYVQVHVDGLATTTDGSTYAVENGGTLTADRGGVRLSAGDFLGLAIQNAGDIHAGSISLAAGDESLVQVSGELDASDTRQGANGGHIQVLGEFVNLEGATLDASGGGGGGTIWVGGTGTGDKGGATAEGTFVDAESELRADATRSGRGGEIMVLATDAAQAHGVISAVGGPGGGAGGFVDTSANVIDVTAEVSVGGSEVGTWLIDPIDVRIVDLADVPVSPDDPFIELIETDEGAFVDFAPGGEPQPNADYPLDDPHTSYVSAQSIEDALGRGADVVVTTESNDPDQPGEAKGNITVSAPIEIPVYDENTELPVIAPGTISSLTLRATNDVNIEESISVASGADLALEVSLQANNNLEMAFELGGGFQEEPVEEKRVGAINLALGKEIRTNGGRVQLSGANLNLYGDIVTEGASVELIAVDLGLVNDEILDANGTEAGHVVVGGKIVTEGGAFTTDFLVVDVQGNESIQTFGEDFTLEATGEINVREVEDDENFESQIRIGQNGDILIEGELIAERVSLSSGVDGVGDLEIGVEFVDTARIEALTTILFAGDGRDADDAPNTDNTLAHITVHDGAHFEAIDPDDGTLRAPESFIFTQDAAITDQDIPEAAQFGPEIDSGVEDMLYIIQTRDGSNDPNVKDLVVGAPGTPKFSGADLALVAPDTIGLGAKIAPKNAELIIDNGFTVTSALADNLRPTTRLRIRSGFINQGDLDFDPGVTLVAPEIGLRAGAGVGDSGDDITSSVNIDIDGVVLKGSDGSAPLERLEISQDDDIASANMPSLDQLPDYTDSGNLSGLSLLLVTPGSITIDEPDRAKVEGSALALSADGGITLVPVPEPEDDDPPADRIPLEVESADVGALFGDFLVTQELLDGLAITPADEATPKLLTLNAPSGTLAFDGIVDEATEEIDSVEVTADIIELIGGAIDLHTNTPVFQTLDGEEAISPQALIYHATLQDITDNDAPTVENFPDELGPRDLMVFQSDASTTQFQISLDQTNTDSAVQNPGDDARGWDFPIQAGAEVVLAAPAVNVRRFNGFDLVLGEHDAIYTNHLELTAIYDPVRFPAEAGEVPLGNAQVDAKDAGLITDFDATLDFTDLAGPQVTVDDEEAAPEPGTPDRFTVVQDGDFLRGAQSLLPDFAAGKPEFNALQTTLGIIEVDHTRFEDTNLTLVSATPGDVLDGELAIDFEETELAVTSFSAQASSSYVNEDGESVVAEFLVDGDAWINAEESITFSALGLGPLRFAAIDGPVDPGRPYAKVILDSPEITLLADDAASFVDAATNEPIFLNAESFRLAQGASILNGASDWLDEDADIGAIPFREQFVFIDDPDATLERYTLESRSGIVEINDLSDLLIAESIFVGAGSITLRADTLDENNLELITGNVRGLELEAGDPVAGSISLEAPRGFVHAGDPRATFTLPDGSGSFSIRQQDAITADDGKRLADISQFGDNGFTGDYFVQSMGGVEVGPDFAERVEESHLVLQAGLLAENIDAAFGSRRGEEPHEDFPDAVYDRFADLNNSGKVNIVDRDLFQAIAGDDIPFVRIGADAEVVDLTLRSLRIQSTPGDGKPILIGSANILTEQDQIYRDEIVLDGTVLDSDDEFIPATFRAEAGLFSSLDPTETLPSSSLTFDYEINALTEFEQGFVASASDLITFGGNLGKGTALGDLTLNLQQILTFTDPAPVAAVSFLGSSDEPDFEVYAANIALNPDAGTEGSLFESQSVPSIATFFHAGGDLLFQTEAGGSFTLGQNQKLSNDGGSLTITTSGALDDNQPTGALAGTATFGDLSVTDGIIEEGDMEAAVGIIVASAEIHLQRREGGEVERANGRFVSDRGTDIVASEINFFFDFDAEADPGGAETLRAAQVGRGADVRFGLASETQTPAFLTRLQVLDLQYNQLERTTDATGLRPVLDGLPDGISRTDISRIFWTDAETPAPTVLGAHRIVDPNGLDAIGVSFDPASAKEARSLARGAAIYNDLGSTSGARADLVNVSEDRLVASEVEQTRRLYLQAFGANGEKAPQVREALQSAVDDYRRSTGARRVVGFELRRYIYNRPSTQFEAYQALQSLDSLFRHHRRSGLTAAEYGPIQREWLRRVKPEGITIDQVSELVNPSRYIRGSDVLDIFGN